MPRGRDRPLGPGQTSTCLPAGRPDQGWGGSPVYPTLPACAPACPAACLCVARRQVASRQAGADRERGTGRSKWGFVLSVSTESKRFNLTAEPACLPCWHRQAEATEEDEIFRANPGTTVLQNWNAFSPASMKEGPIASDSALSACLCASARRQAISAVKNLGWARRSFNQAVPTICMAFLRYIDTRRLTLWKSRLKVLAGRGGNAQSPVPLVLLSLADEQPAPRLALQSAPRSASWPARPR